ncbi:MAG: hypothetical protein Q9P14_17210 [candidate division KSB1 bacterium]|nr:hypothetical protein [candidate division KSB1 bacterium]MDQ7062774.1 hypothetical protein [candidate division KSB1 bacterium]
MYGTIYLARAFFEYKFSDLLLIRAGKFLPPFGIYNERHDATPTFISTVLPFSIYGDHLNSVDKKGRLFSKFATGVWALGSLFVDTWQLKYNIYISNGRGPKPAERDNNPNKALGMRFVVVPPVDFLQIGASYYADRDGNSYDTRQVAIGLDLNWIWGNFELQSEMLLAKGERVDAENRPNGVFLHSRGYYMQGSYTLRDRWTPFMRLDVFDRDTRIRRNEEKHTIIGLNIAISYNVYTKAEVHFIDYVNPNQKDYELFIASVAVAF